MGDASDNIPGVPGVGEKTAMALVQRYGSIDEIYRLLPEIEAKPAAIRKLTEGEESARHSYWLATIVTDAPLEFDPEQNRRRAFKPELYDLFLKLEFSKLIDKYHLRPASQPRKRPSVTPRQSGDRRKAGRGAAFSVAPGRAGDGVWPAGFVGAGGGVLDGTEKCLAAELYSDCYSGDWNGLLKALFSGDIRKVGHNIKDMMGAALEQGLPIDGFVADTALAAYLVDATAGSYDLARLFVTYFNEELPKPVHLEKDAFSLLGDRAAAEAALLSYTSAVTALREVLEKKVQAMGMEELYRQVELPLCAVLARMEQRAFW